MSDRFYALQIWLHQHLNNNVGTLQPLTNDAGFRRYYRLLNSQPPMLAVDAPLATEKPAAFIAIANILQQLDIRVPNIYAVDLNQGFLLLEDLGDDLLISQLSSNNESVSYQTALQTLLKLQRWHNPQQFSSWHLPLFDAAFIIREMQDVQHWVFERYLQLIPTQSLAPFFQQLVDNAVEQPQVGMHRDYHARNLLVLPDKQLGVLDFQDMFIGPITYDLVSLVRDCYVPMSLTKSRDLALQFYEQLELQPKPNTEQFLKWFDWMGLQRHLKAALTFTRKYLRDANANYLKDIPVAFNYITEVAADYPELRVFYDWWFGVVLPTLEDKNK